uniref:Hydroxycinnamoyltransferase 2 n=1 Tax=Narcissus papyraceus TaxID=54854 RepID=A0A346TLF3_NARPA|nr:hydroxycinnamoyltransferase 2 [Narcissus papyraceus]
MATVKVVESELVFPGEETPNHRLWLSNLDIMHALKLPTPLLYVYYPNGDSDFFNVAALKLGLSKALVPYYPLAGRLNKGPDGRLEIDCNSKGALFVVAHSETCIDEFGDFLPSPEMRRLLTPSIPVDDPAVLLMVQVTFFKGGEVILGLAWNHVVGDGVSLNSFMTSWCKMTQGITELGNPPIHDRTILRARSRPKVTFDHVGNQLPTQIHSAQSPTTCSIFKLTKSQLAFLRKNNKFSTFDVVGAHVWRCVCIARGLGRDQEARLNFPIDARGHLRPPLPNSYFGNVVCRLVVVATVDDIISNPIDFTAHKIRGEIKKVNDEYVRSYIDHLEVSTKKKLMLTPAERNTTESTMLPKDSSNSSPSCEPESIAPQTQDNFLLTPSKMDFGVVSWLGFPFSGTDFGWGKPKILRRANISHGCYAYAMDSLVNDGEVLVPVLLETENMERFKKAFSEQLSMHSVERMEKPRSKY